MRKLLVFILLIVSIYGCYSVVTSGYSLGENFTVAGASDIIESSDNVDTLISQLTNINEVQFPSKQSTLATAITTYKTKKAEYEELVALMEQTNSEVDVSLVDIYDVDYLWTVIGNYSTEEGITLKMDIVESTASAVASTDSYTICDLKFTVSGDYIPITDFIYDIEDDSSLGFEISNFSMSKGGDNLQATFVAQSVPINNSNLTEITVSTETETTDDANNTGDTTNTTEDTTTTDDSSTNTTES